MPPPLLSNAIRRAGISKALSPPPSGQHHVFSRDLSEGVVAADQGQTGRCWAFAGLNLLRRHLIRSMGLERDFELSQCNFMFYDKLERSLHFAACAWETRGLPIGHEVVRHLLSDPIPDGGQWHMFVNVVTKHGVVPKSVQPDTAASARSWEMNRALAGMLRRHALAARSAGWTEGEAEEARDALEGRVRTLLTLCLGEPPSDFEWCYSEREGKGSAVRCKRMTPSSLFDACAALRIADFVTLVHCPSREKELFAPYSVRFLNNMRPSRGGGEGVFLNVPPSVLSRAARRSVAAGTPVWFGCEYGEMCDDESGRMHAGLYDLEAVTGEPPLSKEEAVDALHSSLNHAMLITGYHRDGAGGGNVQRWKVENSHGVAIGKGGYLSMSSCWFERYVYVVAVPRRFLPRRAASALSASPPTLLPPWDTIGNLATHSPGDRDRAVFTTG